jgi:hypothetical protein
LLAALSSVLSYVFKRWASRISSALLHHTNPAVIELDEDVVMRHCLADRGKNSRVVGNVNPATRVKSTRRRKEDGHGTETLYSGGSIATEWCKEF